MIKDVKIVTMICDNCGIDICKDSGYSGWDENTIKDLARNNEWRKINNKDYCDDCWEYNDDGNVFVI